MFNTKKQVLLVLITLSLTNCNNDENSNLEYTNLKAIEIGDYKFDFPSQFQPIEEQGIDSYIGKVIGAGIELTYDFGIYTNPYENLPEGAFEVLNEIFGSVERQIVIATNPSQDFTGIHIRDLNNFSDLGNYVSLRMSTK